MTTPTVADYIAADRPILTPRQTQFLFLVADGHTTAEIAQRLFVCEGTVKKGLNDARRRLGANNTAHAVAIGFRRGILANGGGQS